MSKMVIKRDCTEAEFDRLKIETAILKAMKNGSGLVIPEIAESISKEIEEEFTENQEISISEIETKVFDKLVEREQNLTAKAYEGYRSIREFQREADNTTDTELLEMLRGQSDYWTNENANKDAENVTVMRDYMAGIVSKDIANRFLLSPEIVQAHEEGIIHVHDEDYMAQPINNCCLINLEDMLQHGTVINNVRIDKPHRLLTAMTVATQIITAVASSQYGGTSVTLTHLAPFVRDSYNRYLKKYKTRGFESDRADLYAKEDLENEIRDAVQTFNYQINSMSTTNGQAPFITVFMYLDETDEYREELAMLIKEFLNQRIQGFKNEDGVWVTPAFPKLIYALDEDNITEDSPYWYLTKLAAKCTAKRMVPDYISAKKMRELKNGEVYTCMGCLDYDEKVETEYCSLKIGQLVEGMNALMDNKKLIEDFKNSANLEVLL